jgi:cyclophilin family peptidyl-prolyl cis-trans isomerase
MYIGTALGLLVQGLLFLTFGVAGCDQTPSKVAQEEEEGGEHAVAAVAPAAEPSSTLILELKSGKVTIKLRPDLAPKHVERVRQLAKEGFYNGLKFHRVIAGFMAQTGDPLGTGEGGSAYPDLAAEFTPTPFERGTVGAARTADPNSANSQFFICYAPAPHLNGQYTVWGQVVHGMELVDQIAKGEPPPNPDVIVKMYLAEDGAG